MILSKSNLTDLSIMQDAICNVLFFETIPASVYITFTRCCSLVTFQCFPTLSLPQPMLEMLVLHNTPSPALFSPPLFSTWEILLTLLLQRALLHISSLSFTLMHLTIQGITITGISKAGGQNWASNFFLQNSSLIKFAGWSLGSEGLRWKTIVVILVTNAGHIDSSDRIQNGEWQG